jgi:hypothetical protein
MHSTTSVMASAQVYPVSKQLQSTRSIRVSEKMEIASHDEYTASDVDTPISKSIPIRGDDASAASKSRFGTDDSACCCDLCSPDTQRIGLLPCHLQIASPTIVSFSAATRHRACQALQDFDVNTISTNTGCLHLPKITRQCSSAQGFPLCSSGTAATASAFVATQVSM